MNTLYYNSAFLFHYSQVMFAVGRSPCTNIGLDAVAVKLNTKLVSSYITNQFNLYVG